MSTPPPKSLTRYEAISGAVLVALALAYLVYKINHPPVPGAPARTELTAEQRDWDLGYTLARDGHYVEVPPSVLRAGFSQAHLAGFRAGAAENRAKR